MSFENLKLENKGEGEKVTREESLTEAKRLSTLKLNIEQSTHTNNKEINSKLEDSNLKKSILKFLQDAANNNLVGDLDVYNSDNFDNDSEQGLDKIEFKQFIQTLESQINIIINSDVENLDYTNSDASIKRLNESLGKGFNFNIDKVVFKYESFISHELIDLPEEIKRKILKSIKNKINKASEIVDKYKQIALTKGNNFSDYRWIINEEIVDLFSDLDNEVLPSAYFLMKYNQAKDKNKFKKDVMKGEEYGSRFGYTLTFDSSIKEIQEYFDTEPDVEGKFGELMGRDDIMEIDEKRDMRMLKKSGYSEDKLGRISLLNEKDKKIEKNAQLWFMAACVFQAIPFVGTVSSIPIDIRDIFSSDESTMHYLQSTLGELTGIPPEYKMNKTWVDNAFAAVGLVGSIFGANSIIKMKKFMKAAEKMDISSSELENAIFALGENMGMSEKQISTAIEKKYSTTNPSNYISTEKSHVEKSYLQLQNQAGDFNKNLQNMYIPKILKEGTKCKWPSGEEFTVKEAYINQYGLWEVIDTKGKKQNVGPSINEWIEYNVIQSKPNEIDEYKSVLKLHKSGRGPTSQSKIDSVRKVSQDILGKGYNTTLNKQDYHKYFSSPYSKESSILSQGNTSNCYLVATIDAMNNSPHFELMIRTSLKKMDNGDWQITIPLMSTGLKSKKITITQKEISRYVNPGIIDHKKIINFDKKAFVNPLNGNEGFRVLEAAFIKGVFGKVDRLKASNGTLHPEHVLNLFGDTLFKHIKMESIVKDSTNGKVNYLGISNHKDIDSFLKNYDPNVDIAIVYGIRDVNMRKISVATKEKLKEFINEHAYSIRNVNLGNETVTLANPHNTSKPITISIGEFKEIFSGIQSVKIDFNELIDKAKLHQSRAA